MIIELYIHMVYNNNFKIQQADVGEDKIDIIKFFNDS